MPCGAATRSAKTAENCAPRCSYQLVQCRARDQSQLARPGNRWPVPENGEILTLDRVQNFLPATAEQLNVDSQLATYLSHQRQAALEPLAGALDLEAHQIAELRRVVSGGQVCFRDPEPAQVFERKIDAAFLEIYPDVLPEIGQLQRGTGVVGKLLPLRVAIAAKIQDQMAYRVCRIAAIAEQVFKGFIASHTLVLAKRGQQIRELVPRDIELTHGPSQGDKHRMPRLSLIAGIELRLPFVQQLQRCRPVAGLIAEVIRNPAVGI